MSWPAISLLDLFCTQQLIFLQAESCTCVTVPCCWRGFFLSMLPLLNCPKSGNSIFTSISVEVQYFSVLHSQIALKTAVRLALFWSIFTTDCAKDNYFDVELKMICQFRLWAGPGFQFQERISLWLISYFLYSYLLHLLQLSSGLYTVYSTLYIGDNYFNNRKRQCVCSKLWTSLVNMCLSL